MVNTRYTKAWGDIKRKEMRAGRKPVASREGSSQRKGRTLARRE